MESNKIESSHRAISYGLKSKIPSLAGRAILAPYQRGRLWRRAMCNFLGTEQAGPRYTRRHQENEIAGRAELLRQARLGGLAWASGQNGAKLP